MTQALIQSIQQETQAIAAFGRALAQEREALKTSDFEALSGLLARKEELARELSTLGAAREARMTALGLRTGPGGQLFGRHVDPAVADAWRKLVFFASMARDANQLNGAVIGAHLEFTQEAIQVLRQGGEDAGALYGRDGKAQNASGGVSLASG